MVKHVSRSLSLSLSLLGLVATACALSDDPDVELDEADELGEGEDDDDRGGAVRICTGCTYKSTVSFSGLPLGTITSATMQAKVTHSGACPQSGYPSNCTEVLDYNVKCKLGTSSSVTIPFFIDASSTNTTHTAKITVNKGGVITTHTGTVNFSSNVTGGGAPPSSIPTPCPAPTLNPYAAPTIPTVL